LEFIQQNLHLIIMAAVSGGGLLFLSLRGSGGGSSLNPTQTTQMINREDALVIDVSEPVEFEGGHLPEAKNYPSGKFEERMASLQQYKDKTVILVCQTGARSASAQKMMAKNGFAKAFTLEGGIAAWRGAGLPVKKGAK
jgi:rhodanese-related sulfurtransferase